MDFDWCEDMEATLVASYFVKTAATTGRCIELADRKDWNCMLLHKDMQALNSAYLLLASNRKPRLVYLSHM